MRFSDDVASKIRVAVRSTCNGIDTLRRWRRKTGKSPKTWMLKSVRLKTELVDGKREASTVEAIRAAFVDSDDGNGGARAWDAARADELMGAPVDDLGTGMVRESIGVYEVIAGLVGVRLR